MENKVIFSQPRDLSIDIIRCVCMICIVLAHVNPPALLHTLRSFDVVGLVMISAICMKPNKSVPQYFSSILKRVRRLVVPTYIFILCVLISVYILCLYFKIPYLYDRNGIISAFLLIDGIGYVWIIRVLLINAVLSPLLFKLSSYQAIYVLVGSFLLLLVSKYLLILVPSQEHLSGFILYYYYLYTVGYFIIALYALLIKKSNYRSLLKHILIILALLIVYKLVFSYLLDENVLVLQKHPPMFDWIAYGIIITDLLFIITRRITPLVQSNKYILKSITWFSANSFQVYFIHAWLIIMYNAITRITGCELAITWWIKFILVFFISVLAKVSFDTIVGWFRTDKLNG